MLISDAQPEVRTVYLGGFVGQLVSALIWFVSAAIATFVDPLVFLYGMNTFAVLAAVLTGAGFAIGFMAPEQVVMGGWVRGAVLFAFAFGLLAAFRRGLAA
jgi:hypothetical protein